MLRITLLLTCLFANLIVFAQKHNIHGDHERCATMLFYEQEKLLNPNLEKEQILFELRIDKWIADNYNKTKNTKDILIIPVVVHVIWHFGAQNVSIERVNEQIERLNFDYRKMNEDIDDLPDEFDPFATDCQIEFAMSRIDPDGQPTEGVTRTYTENTSYVYNAANQWIKHTADGGHDAWDSDKYLNMWVCNIDGGILGYAQFPWDPDGAEDGVVITYWAFGNTTGDYDMGRTATHEIGHWLSLYHVWGDDGGACTGSDLVDDTPNQADHYFGTPIHPQYSCGSNDMFMNYMDYVDDEAMIMFTAGQSTRMWAAIDTYRDELGQDSLHVPLPPLPAPASLESSLDFNNVTLNWMFNADTSSLKDSLICFNIYRNEGHIYTITDTSLRSYEDLNLPDSTYIYYLTALYNLDVEVESSASNSVTVNIETLFPPENLTANVVESSVELSWDAPNKAVLIGYNVYRDDELIAEIDDSQLTYTDDSLPDDTYTYNLRSVDDLGMTSEPSNYEEVEVLTLSPDFEADKTQVHGGHTVNFTDLTVGDVTAYSWYFEGGIADFTDIPNPETRYDSAGTYNVILTVTNDFNTKSSSKINYITCLWDVKVQEINEQEILVYPNPAKEQIHIEVTRDIETDIVIELYDLAGKMIMQETFVDKTKITLNLENLNTGIYTLNVRTGINTHSVKITIQ